MPKFKAARLVASPLGRRLLLVVLGCALLPILVLGVLDYREVTQHLRQEAQRRLHQQTKAMAMSLVERLQFVEASLEMLATTGEWNAGSNDVSTTGLGAALRRQFTALSLVRPDGGSQALIGAALEPRSLDRGTRDHLVGGRTKVVVGDRIGPAVQMLAARAVNPASLEEGVLWAELSAAYLWGIGQESTLPAFAELAALDDQGFLVRSTSVPPKRMRAARSGWPPSVGWPPVSPTTSTTSCSRFS